jgi:hypothetical protein
MVIHQSLARHFYGGTGKCLHTLRADGPYAGMNITGAIGISAAQKAALKTLGAVDE